MTAISIFKDYAGAEESNKRALAWIEQSLTPVLAGPATGDCWASDRPYFGLRFKNGDVRDAAQ